MYVYIHSYIIWRKVLGEDVRAVAEPDKVVYRVVEGIAEVRPTRLYITVC